MSNEKTINKDLHVLVKKCLFITLNTHKRLSLYKHSLSLKTHDAAIADLLTKAGVP